MKINQLFGCCQGCQNTAAHAVAWCGKSLSAMGACLMEFAKNAAEYTKLFFYGIKEHLILHRHTFGLMAVGIFAVTLLVVIFNRLYPNVA